MQSYGIDGYGEMPALRQLPRPTPRRGEILVRIRACGLNFADLLMIEGKYQERPLLPVVLGMELAGIVQELGPGVDRPQSDTQVALFAGFGGLAETGCFPAERAVALPKGMTLTDAAAFQVAYGTSHLALSHRANRRVSAGWPLATVRRRYLPEPSRKS